MKAPCNQSQQPESGPKLPCKHCGGKGHIWRGKNKTSCIHCHNTGVAQSGYKTK